MYVYIYIYTYMNYYDLLCVYVFDGCVSSNTVIYEYQESTNFLYEKNQKKK